VFAVVQLVAPCWPLEARTTTLLHSSLTETMSKFPTILNRRSSSHWCMFHWPVVLAERSTKSVSRCSWTTTFPLLLASRICRTSDKWLKYHDCTGWAFSSCLIGVFNDPNLPSSWTPSAESGLKISATFATSQRLREPITGAIKGQDTAEVFPLQVNSSPDCYARFIHYGQNSTSLDIPQGDFDQAFMPHVLLGMYFIMASSSTPLPSLLFC